MICVMKGKKYQYSDTVFVQCSQQQLLQETKQDLSFWFDWQIVALNFLLGFGDWVAKTRPVNSVKRSEQRQNPFLCFGEGTKKPSLVTSHHTAATLLDS